MSGYYVGKNVAVSGPLAGVAEDFADVLWERGYSPRTLDVQMRMLRDLSRWLGDAGIALAAFDDNLVDSYVAQRRQRTQTLRSSLALTPLLGFLRDQGMVPPPSTVVVRGADSDPGGVQGVPAPSARSIRCHCRQLLLPGPAAGLVGRRRELDIAYSRTSSSLHRRPGG